MTEDIRWAAGFIEGEGSFGYYGQTLRVSASQNSTWPLEKLQTLFGGKIGQSKGRPAYKWWVTGATAHKAMIELRPLMSPRRQAQIDAAITQRMSGRINRGTLERVSVMPSEPSPTLAHRAG